MTDHIHDYLLRAGHSVVQVPVSMLPTRPSFAEHTQSHGCADYVAAMAASYCDDGCPPIVGLYIDGAVLQADGNHRYQAAVAAGVTHVPMILFRSKDEMLRAVEYARETPRERDLRLSRVADARYHLASGRRLPAPVREQLEREVQPEPRAIEEL